MGEEMIRDLPLWRQPIEIAPLSGGLTNHNYTVRHGEERFAVRECSPQPWLGIDRQNEQICAQQAARLGLGPEVVYATDGVLVTRFVTGAPLAEDTKFTPALLKRIAEHLHRLHDSGTVVEGHMMYFGPFQAVRTLLREAEGVNAELPTPGDALRGSIAELENHVQPFVPTFCHNDLMPGNLLVDDEHVWLVDWEYAGIGHPLFDVAGLASNCRFNGETEEAWLKAYGVGPDQLPTYLAMRAVAALRESMWGAVQSRKSTLDFDFQAYCTANFEAYREAKERLVQ